MTYSRNWTLQEAEMSENDVFETLAKKNELVGSRRAMATDS